MHPSVRSENAKEAEHVSLSYVQGEGLCFCFQASSKGELSEARVLVWGEVNGAGAQAAAVHFQTKHLAKIHNTIQAMPFTVSLTKRR